MVSFLRKLFGKPSPEEVAASEARVKAAVRKVRAMARPFLQVVPTRGGTSWLGGHPHLPAGQEWPRRGQVPMAFLAQLDLAQMQAATRPDWLPSEGQLLFFYDHEYGAGLEPGDDQSWTVIHLPAGTETSKVPFPPDLAKNSRFNGYPVRFKAARSIPGWERRGQLTEGLSKKEVEAVDNAIDPNDYPQPDHQIGGFAHPVQTDDMELECEALARGLSRSAAYAPISPHREALEEGAKGWRLLLQLDSDDRMGTQWFDAGSLYFWIREADARKADFSKVALLMQFS